jgi:putative membrane protein
MRKTQLAALVATPLVLAAVPGFAAGLSSADHRFIDEAATGGMAEVQEGQLAQQKASSSEVKQFASQMVTDHTEANNELVQIAQSKGVTPPAHPTRAERKSENGMKRLSGAAFDRHYASEQVKDHQKTVALFQKEANSGTDPELKAFAQKYLPKLQQHLQMAQALNKG